jgi:hypothetical protein
MDGIWGACPFRPSIFSLLYLDFFFQNKAILIFKYVFIFFQNSPMFIFTKNSHGDFFQFGSENINFVSVYKKIMGYI